MCVVGPNLELHPLLLLENDDEKVVIQLMGKNLIN